MCCAAGMAITVAQFQSHLDAARTAIGITDYTTAESEALQAQTCLAGIPDGELDGNRVEWRETIRDLLANIRRAAGEQRTTAAGGVQRTKTTYAKTTD